MTTTIRKVNQFELYQDNFTRLYAVSDDSDVSLWMDHYNAEYLLNASYTDFIKGCSELLY